MIPNKELESEFKDLKSERTRVKKYGEYILKLINKVTYEPFRNMIVFCDVDMSVTEECSRRFQFALQTRYQTYLINFESAKSNSPVYVMDNMVYNSEGAVVMELSSLDKDDENPYGMVLLNVCYTDTPLLILKNDNYYNASSLLLNVSELKQFIENDRREELGSKRYEILDFLYGRFYHKTETSFVKNMKTVLDI